MINTSDMYQAQKLRANGLQAQNQDLRETIAAQQQVLDQIAAALGVKAGDVEGIGVAVEELQGKLAKCLEAMECNDPGNYKALAGREAV